MVVGLAVVVTVLRVVVTVGRAVAFAVAAEFALDEAATLALFCVTVAEGTGIVVVTIGEFVSDFAASVSVCVLDEMSSIVGASLVTSEVILSVEVGKSPSAFAVLFA